MSARTAAPDSSPALASFASSRARCWRGPQATAILARIARGPHLIAYHEGSLPGDPPGRFRLFGHCRTDRIYVELRHDDTILLRSFRSLLSNRSVHDRREGIAGADLAEAFRVLREMRRKQEATPIR